MPTGIGAGIAGRVFKSNCCGGTPPVTPSWNCTAAGCIDPGDGSGTYSSLGTCQNSCVPPCPNVYSCQFINNQGPAANQWLNNNTSALSVGVNGEENFTIAFWVKFDSVTTGNARGIISWGAGNDPKMQIYLTPNGLGIQFNMTNISAGGNTWNDGTGTISPATNTWIHYAYVADRESDPFDMTGEWFQNGISVGSKSGPFPVATNDMNFPTGDNFYFGRRQSNPTTEALQGNLDDFTIWNKALTASEIQQVMAIGQSQTDCMSSLSFYGLLTHWWEMGDNHTPPGPSTFPTIVDSVGSIDLTMVNMAGTNIVADTP